MSVIVIDPNSVPAPTPPTDTQLAAFVKERGMRLPEMRVITVVRFSAKAMASKATVDPAAVQKLFDYNKASLEQPEKRSLIVIPAKDAATAQAVAGQIKAGKAPQAAAAAVGVQPIVYNATAKAAVADSKVADAAFSMKTGEVAAVQGSLGNAVVVVGPITSAVSADLDKERPQLEAKVRENAAAQLAYAAFQKYDDAHSGGASLADAAKAAGVAPVDVGPMTAQGQAFSKPPEGVLSPRVLKVAFSLPAGGESDVQDEGGGEYFVVKVDKVNPPQAPSINDLRADLTKGYMASEISKRMVAKAQDIIAKTDKGMSLDAAAASAGAKVQHATGVSRANPASYKAFGQSFAPRLFQAKVGQVFAGATTEEGLGPILVARIDSIEAAPQAEAAAATSQFVGPVSKELFGDALKSVQRVARDQIKPKTDLARARQAIGASAADAPPAPLDAPKPGLAQ